ncbi:hypothetical protein Tco_1374920, partial [Tanacetum coccineum]
YNNVNEESQKIKRQAPVMISDAEEYLISEDPDNQGRMERMENLKFCDKHNVVNWEYILLGMTEAKDSEVCKITRADGSSNQHVSRKEVSTEEGNLGKDDQLEDRSRRRKFYGT